VPHDDESPAVKVQSSPELSVSTHASVTSVTGAV
jgi:hypothetical protein